MGHTHLHAVLIFYAWTAVASIGVLSFLFVPAWWWSAILILIGLIVTAAFTLAPLSKRKRAEAQVQSAGKGSTAVDDAVARLDPLDAAADSVAVGIEPTDAETDVALGRLHEKGAST
jgi:UDP-GlcNAc:undecaprenyl-phosphate GlcNAc-1-phosphate transferase